MNSDHGGVAIFEGNIGVALKRRLKYNRNTFLSDELELIPFCDESSRRSSWRVGIPVTYYTGRQSGRELAFVERICDPSWLMNADELKASPILNAVFLYHPNRVNVNFVILTDPAWLWHERSDILASMGQVDDFEGPPPFSKSVCLPNRPRLRLVSRKNDLLSKVFAYGKVVKALDDLLARLKSISEPRFAVTHQYVMVASSDPGELGRDLLDSMIRFGDALSQAADPVIPKWRNTGQLAFNAVVISIIAFLAAFILLALFMFLRL